MLGLCAKNINLASNAQFMFVNTYTEHSVLNVCVYIIGIYSPTRGYL